MKPKKKVVWLIRGLLVVILTISGAPPCSAVERAPQALSNSSAIKLSLQVERLEQYLSTLQAKLEANSTLPDLGQTLIFHHNSFKKLQQEIEDHFRKKEILLKKHFDGSDLELILARQNKARNQARQNFEQIYQGLNFLRQNDAVSVKLPVFLKKLRGFLSINHQHFDPEQLLVTTVNTPIPLKPHEMFFEELPHKPQPQDIEATYEIQFSTPIESLTEELQEDPQKLYQWVCNHISFQPGYGSKQGAELTLYHKTGNPWDQASLLISLLRKAGIPARYAYGWVQPTQEQLKSWLGVKTLTTAYQILDQAGIPREGNSLEHIWVKAYLAPQDSWVDLDPSFKQHSFERAIVKQEDRALLQNLLKFTETSERINTALVPIEYTSEQAVIIPRQINSLEETSGLKYTCRGQAYRLPAELRWKLNFNLAGNSHSFSLQKIACNPISIAYLPAEDIDSHLIGCFNEVVADLPAYLIKLQPYLILGKDLIKLGNPVKMGTPQQLMISWQLKDISHKVQHLLLAGMNAVWAANWGQLPSSLDLLKTGKISGVKERFNSYVNKTIRDEFYLTPLMKTALSYQIQNQRIGNLLAQYSSVYFAPGFSEGLVALAPQANFVFDLPLSFSCRGVQIDIQKDSFLLASQDGTSAGRTFVALKGALGSALEHQVLETNSLLQEQSVEAVSAIKLLSLAIDQNISVYSLDASNIAEFSELGDMSYPVRQDVVDAVRAGKTIIIPKHPLQLDDWKGISYIVVDRDSGNNAYLLTGGLGGGNTSGFRGTAGARSTIRIPYPKSTVGKIIMATLILIAAILIAVAL